MLQIKDAIRDGLRAVSNTILDGFVIRGAGAFEVCFLSTCTQQIPKWWSPLAVVRLADKDIAIQEGVESF